MDTRPREVIVLAQEMQEGYEKLTPVLLEGYAFKRLLGGPERARCEQLANNYAAMVVDLPLICKVSQTTRQLEIFAEGLTALFNNFLGLFHECPAALESMERVKNIMFNGCTAHPKLGYPIAR